jgi:hypothetical protein
MVNAPWRFPELGLTTSTARNDISVNGNRWHHFDMIYPSLAVPIIWCNCTSPKYSTPKFRREYLTSRSTVSLLLAGFDIVPLVGPATALVILVNTTISGNTVSIELVTKIKNEIEAYMCLVEESGS